jgi:RNA polymerase sigma-70 factor (ECF subfamily)
MTGAELDHGFDELFRANYARLVAIGVSMSGDRELARDLAQETMVRAHRRWEEVSVYDRPDAWLRRVMNNLLIDHHRARVTERSTLERLRSGIGTRPPDSADSAVGEWLELTAGLSAHQRAVATLFYGEDRPVDEIASILGISVGTVKSTLSKARRSIERRLTKEADDA